jgi:hypothetical protein
MRADQLTLYVSLACVTLVFALILAVFVKLFARPLAFFQAFFVSLVAAGVSMALYIFYTLSKPAFGLAGSTSADGLVTLVMMSVMGSIITRLLRQYGIEKTGWLGVGAKIMLSLLVLSWVLVGAVFLFLYLKPG